MPPDQMALDVLAILNRLTRVTELIAHGDATGPAGLELLALAISGTDKPGHRNLCDAIEEHGTQVHRGLSQIASSIEALADAVASGGPGRARGPLMPDTFTATRGTP